MATTYSARIVQPDGSWYEFDDGEGETFEGNTAEEVREHLREFLGIEELTVDAINEVYPLGNASKLVIAEVTVNYIDL